MASEDLTAGDDTWHYYINGMSDEDLKKQFNPLVKDNFAPTFEITSIEKQADYYASVSFLGQKVGVYKSGYIKVEGEAFDITGIRYVKVTVETDDENVYTFEAQSENDLPTSMAFSTETDLSVDEYLFGKYPVTVEACDGAGNTAMVEKEVKGVFNDLAELFLDFLVDSWNTAVEVATALGNMIWEWIMEQVNKLWDVVLEPLFSILENSLQFITDGILKLCSEINDFYWDGNAESNNNNFDMEKELREVEDAKNFIISALFEPVVPLFEILNKIKPLMEFIEPFQYLIDPTSLLMLIVGEVPGLSSTLENLMSTLTGSISGATVRILDLLMPFFGVSDKIELTKFEDLILNPFAFINWANQLSWDPITKGFLVGIQQWLTENTQDRRSGSDTIVGFLSLASGLFSSWIIWRGWLEAAEKFVGGEGYEVLKKVVRRGERVRRHLSETAQKAYKGVREKILTEGGYPTNFANGRVLFNPNTNVYQPLPEGDVISHDNLMKQGFQEVPMNWNNRFGLPVGDKVTVNLAKQKGLSALQAEQASETKRETRWKISMLGLTLGSAIEFSVSVMYFRKDAGKEFNQGIADFFTGFGLGAGITSTVFGIMSESSEGLSFANAKTYLFSHHGAAVFDLAFDIGLSFANYFGLIDQLADYIA